MRLSARATAVLTAVAVFGVGTAVAVAGTSPDPGASGTPVTCHQDAADGTLTCPYPTGATETVTRTDTVTVTNTVADTVTVTAPGDGTTNPPPSDPSAPSDPSSPPSSGSSSPIPSNFPDAASTGVPTGTTLTRIPEDLSSGAGWVYSAVDQSIRITGAGTQFCGFATGATLVIAAANVTVCNDDIEVADPAALFAIRATDALSTNLTIRDSDIHGVTTKSSPDCDVYGLVGEPDGYRVLRNDVSGFDHPLQGEAGLYQDNYVHGLCSNGASDAAHTSHSDAFFSGGGDPRPLTLMHNTLVNDDSGNGATASIMLNGYGGQQANRVIENNLLGGGGYCFYGGQDARASDPQNITFTGNAFTTSIHPQCGYYSYGAHWVSGHGNVWSDNVWADGPKAGAAVPEP